MAESFDFASKGEPDTRITQSTLVVNKSPSPHIYEGDVKERAISRDNLRTRLDLNSRYQSTDFHDWLHRRLNVMRGEHILDVGCGTGAQSLRFLECIGPRGSVSALDISPASVEELVRNANGDLRLVAVTADMADLDEVIRARFKQRSYTLAHSSYSLYYSPSRMAVLRRMADSLLSHGRLAVFTPTTPHGLVEIASKFSVIPEPVMESLEFGPSVLEPEFRSLFWEVEINFFQSEMRVTSVDDFMGFYRATTYYSAQAEPGIRRFAESELRSKGAVIYSKNGYLIIGRDRR